MRQKKQVLKFLNDNHCMINSLMCESERKMFNGDVVVILESEIKKQIKEEENELYQSKVFKRR